MLPLRSVEVRPRDRFIYWVKVDLHDKAQVPILRWCFYTLKRNIAFGLCYRPFQDAANDRPEVADILVESLAKDLYISHPSERFGRLSRTSSQAGLSKNASTSNLIIEANNDSISNFSDTNSGGGRSLSASPNIQNEPFMDHAGKGVIHLLPVERFESSQNAIRGEWRVPLQGYYGLVFDNTFSIHTAKKLFFSVQLEDPRESPRPPTAKPNVLLEGWLMKKKSKIMQGWARRWCTIDATGHFAYREDEPGPVRGSASLLECTVSVVPHRRKIILDGRMSTIHLRSFSDEEYAQWLDCIHQVKQAASCKFTSNLRSTESRNHLLWESIETARSQAAERIERLTAVGANCSSEPLQEHLAALEESYSALLAYHSLLKQVHGSESSTAGFHDGIFADAISFHEEASEVFFDAHDLIISDSDSESEADNQRADGSMESITQTAEKNLLIARSVLPAPAPPMNISIASILRKTIGKDSSSVPMPVILNEPLNGLQRLCEELEYSDLLDRAASFPAGSAERALWVAVFAVSSYASSVHRAERKPFNPMLGETFELDCPTRQFRFVSEKVSHRPLVLACHAASPKWQWWQDQKIKSKFWGRSVEYIPSGQVHVRFASDTSGDAEEEYWWGKVVSCLRNVMSSNKWIENYGDMVIRTTNSPSPQAIITFKNNSSGGGGLFSSSGPPSVANEIVGKVTAGGQEISFHGRWDDAIYRDLGQQGRQLELLWKTNSMPPNHREYYGFTYWALGLNDLATASPGLLPPTDTRLRPDQRLLEEGRVEEAEAEKARIEQLQRDTRSAMETAGMVWKPRWFIQQRQQSIDDPDGDWVYDSTSDYWKVRESKAWPSDLPRLW